MIEVRIISTGDHPTWDQYVLQRDVEGVYLSSAWKEVLEKSYGLQTFYLAAYNQQIMKGVLPLALIKFPWGKGSLFSLPFCDYGGVFSDSSEIAEFLLVYAVALAKKLGAGLEIRLPVPLPALEQSTDFYQATKKCRMVLELPDSAALLWDGFKSKLRSQIKRSGKEGLICRMGHLELVPDFYRVFSRNMRDLGSPVHSEKWLHSVVTAYGERARVGVVYKDKIPVAGGVILSHGVMMTIPWASALRKYKRLSPNMLIYWTFLEYACDNNFKFFDFGRSTPNEGTYAFKKQWGARPVPLFWYKQGVQPAESKRDKAGVLRLLLEQVWARLPLSVANALGPLIRKYIAR